MTLDSIAETAASTANAAPLPGSSNAHAEWLRRLNLHAETVLSDDGGDSFVTILCRDEAGRRVVLKYVRGESADAHRRLKNEAQLIKHLPVRAPLRLLPYRADGHGYLVTEFDPGTLLRPDRFDDGIALTIAEALAEFHSTRSDVRALGIVDRERLSTYYVKVLAKHLLHLWPAHLTAWEASRCSAIVTAALPAIARRSAICHGDLIPTNLLHHDDGSITFTDLEGFMSANHPLFDVIAFFSISGRDLSEWSWQPSFLARYLGAAAALGLDPSSTEYADAYRGILIFFLVYRLNEERILATNGSYFDGQAKPRFLARKAAGVVTLRREVWRDDTVGDALDVRKRNLQRALSPDFFREHLSAMHAGLGARP
jgi:thiamine kinase-like enzyme